MSEVREVPPFYIGNLVEACLRLGRVLREAQDKGDIELPPKIYAALVEFEKVAEFGEKITQS